MSFIAVCRIECRSLGLISLALGPAPLGQVIIALHASPVGHRLAEESRLRGCHLSLTRMAGASGQGYQRQSPYLPHLHSWHRRFPAF
jgi:hypothetical protein